MAAQIDQHFARARNVGDAEVVGEHDVAGGVGEDAERAGDQHGGHDREAVEAVGQVHRVARADDHEIRQRHEQHAERHHDVLEERHVERRIDGGLRREIQRQRRAKPATDCQKYL